MTTIHSPINDQFDSILSDLASNIVNDWDLKTCTAFCVENLEQNWKSFSIQELVEQYELHHNSSIDHEGLSMCILDLSNEDEARVLTESINTHYLEQESDDSE